MNPAFASPEPFTSFEVAFTDAPARTGSTPNIVHAEGHLLLDTGRTVKVKVVMPMSIYCAICGLIDVAAEDGPFGPDEIVIAALRGEYLPDAGRMVALDLVGLDRVEVTPGRYRLLARYSTGPARGPALVV